MIGSKLAHFAITGKLGEGGMGVVYRATDTKLKRDVAIKVLPEDFVADPERLERFQREAEAVAALDHPNIVTVYSIEEADGARFIVMQLVEGAKLTDRIPPGGLPIDRLFDVAVPLADAMSAAHDRGITHRDLKPDNVMIGADGRVRVLDFGLAKVSRTGFGEAMATEMATELLTQEGRVVGTVAYMSPEQAEGRPVDARADVFSLGIMLYELATGSRPFAGDNAVSTITSILRDTPAPVHKVRADLPRHLGRIIGHCLTKDPERRFQSAKELRNELEHLHDELKSGDSKVRAGESSTSVRPAARPSPNRFRRWLLPGAVGLAVLLGALLWLSRGSTRQPAGSSAEGRASVAVVGFENLSDPDDSEHLGRMLMSLVTTDLSESGGLAVVSSAKVLASVKKAGGGETAVFDASLAAEAAELAGAGVMLFGQLLERGNGVLLTAELVDVASGNTLGSLRKDAASDAELFDLAGAIAAQVRDRLGVSGGEASLAIDLAKTLTDSPDAYRHYAIGEIGLHERRFEAATENFRKARELDPSFALAYYREAMASSWGNSGSGTQILEAGMPWVGRLPERWQKVYRGTLHYRKGEPEEAFAALTELVESDTDIPDAYNMLGEIRTHYSRFEDSLSAISLFERALELDPTFKLVFFHLSDDYVKQDDADKAEALLARYRKDNPDDRAVAFGEVRLRAARRQWREAAKAGKRMIEERGETSWFYYIPSLEFAGEVEAARQTHDARVEETDGFERGISLSNRAQFFLSRGHFAAAFADFEAADRLITILSIRSDVLLKHAFGRSSIGETEPAIALARQAVDVDPWNGHARFTLAKLLANSGQTAEASRVLDDLRSIATEGESPYPACWVRVLEAEHAVVAGEYRSADDTLDRLEGKSCHFNSRNERRLIGGAVQKALGNTEAAIEAYREIVYPPELFLPYARDLYSILALFELARVEHSSGDLASAREHYRRFVEHWGNADYPIPEVAEARSALADLFG